MLVLLMAACSGGDIQKPSTEDTAVTLGVLEVASLEPAQGGTAGGTELQLTGLGFTVATAVSIDGAACGELALLSPELLACTTPPGSPGVAEVRVIREDGVSATAEFTYIEDTGTTTPDDTDTTDTETTDTTSDTGDTGPPTDTETTDTETSDTGTTALEPVDYCHLQWPCAQTLAPSEPSEAVYCWVYEAGITDEVGEGAGLLTELGWGPDGSNPAVSAWTWTEMSWLEDVYYKEALANDLYAGTFTAPSAAGSYDYACRVSADGGASWTVCDAGDDGAFDTCGDGLEGSLDGYSALEAGQLTVE